ncbi:hypothetical protein RAS1_09180 [Phycisphaerae bacterium RAS1]|nr:hypothetical protein RAS1_09180 [Phycisphaerae bacterium RAS1]
MTRLVLMFVLTLVAGCAEARRGVLVMAHGGDGEWNRAIEQVVAPLRDKYPTEIAFGMADSSTMRTGVQRLEERGVREIAVVRMFISGESFLPETEYILSLRRERPAVALVSDSEHEHHGHHMAPPEPIQTSAKIIVSREGVAESPLVDDILVERVKALSTSPSQESVLILAHGPGDDGENSRWLANMERRMRRVRESGQFREVHCETLREDWPEKRAEAEQRIRRCVEEGRQNDGRVIVIPFRIAGFGPYAEVLKDLDYVADARGFCPHPNMTRWLEETANECFR